VDERRCTSSIANQGEDGEQRMEAAMASNSAICTRSSSIEQGNIILFCYAPKRKEMLIKKL